MTGRGWRRLVAAGALCAVVVVVVGVRHAEAQETSIEVTVSCTWTSGGLPSCGVRWSTALTGVLWWVTWWDGDGQRISHTTDWDRTYHAQGLDPVLASNAGGRVQVLGCVAGVCERGQALWSRPADPDAPAPPAQATTTTVSAAAMAAGPTAAIELGQIEADLAAVRSEIRTGALLQAERFRALELWLNTIAALLGAILAVGFYQAWRWVARRESDRD